MQNKKITFIDFAKGFSILTIVVMHYFQRMNIPGWMSKGVLLGGTGIHVFILLSGFGLMLSKYKGWQHFLRRRASKILLPYYFFITLLFLINFFVLVNPTINWYAYLGTIFFFQLFDHSIIYSFGIQFWFISTILQFYLLFPLLRAGITKLGLSRFMLGSLAVSLGYLLIIYLAQAGEHKQLSRLFPVYLWEFAAGMVLAKKYQTQQFQFWNISYKWWLLGFIGGFGCMAMLTLYLGNVGVLFNDIPAMIGYLSITILLYQLSNVLRSFLQQGMLFIGKYSYPLYLIHIAVLVGFLYFTGADNPLLINVIYFLIYLFITLILSFVYDKIYQWTYTKLFATNKTQVKNI